MVLLAGLFVLPFATISSGTPMSFYSAGWQTSSSSFAMANGGSYTVSLASGVFQITVNQGSDTSFTASGSACGTAMTFTQTTYSVYRTFSSQTLTLPTSTACTVSASVSGSPYGGSTSFSATVTYVPPTFTMSAYAIVDGGSPQGITSSSNLQVTPSDTVAFEIIAGGASGYSGLGGYMSCSVTSGTCPFSGNIGMTQTSTPPTGACPSGALCWVSSAYSFPTGTYTVTGYVTGAGFPQYTAFSILGSVGGSVGFSMSVSQYAGLGFIFGGIVLIAAGRKEDGQ